MNLRPGKLPIGFWSYKDKGNQSFKKIKKIKTNNLKISTACKKDLRVLNYLILKDLISRFRSPIIKSQMNPSCQFINFLRSNYDITNRFKNATKLLVDNNFIIKR